MILVSAVLVLSCGQTDQIAEVDDRYTTVGVSNDCSEADVDVDVGRKQAQAIASLPTL